MRYSLTKIAEELGLSKATVSLVLNGKARQARISKEVEQRIKTYCEEVNYLPNIHAQRLNRKHVKNIGMLIERNVKHDTDNPFLDPNTALIVGGAVLAAASVDYRITIQLYDSRIEESKVFSWFRNHEIDGLIYYGLSLPEDWRKVFAEERRHVVGIGIEPAQGITCININNYELAYNLTNMLIEKGKENFIYLEGIEHSYVSQQRKKGFLSAINENNIGIDAENIITANFSEVLAKEKIIQLHNNRLSDIDAIVCGNDDMAIGVIKALNKLNIKLPEQIAVTGADNIPVSNYFDPTLTTIDNCPKILGEKAFDTIYNIINGKQLDEIIVCSQLIVRDST